MPFQLVYTDLMGRISPPAMVGFKLVSKITDKFTVQGDIPYPNQAARHQGHPV